MSAIAPGLFLGFEEATFEEMAGFVSAAASLGTTVANQHTDASGDLIGLQSMSMGNGQNMIIEPRRTDIPWEDIVIECWSLVTSTGTYHLEARNGVTTTNEMRRSGIGQVTHYVNNVLQATEVGFSMLEDVPKMVSTHVYHHATTGFLTTWIDGQQKLDTQNVNTNAGGANMDKFRVRHVGSGTGYADDLGVRPRTILVDGVTSADSATPSGTITGTTSTETGVIYAWENDSDDSNNGGGDPSLAAGQWRLYLKNVSFGPDATTGGFQNNEAITGHGLTGTVLCDAPHTGYMLGLEPGSMFFYQKLHIIRMAPNAVGTENTDGSLQGGATDRLDALDTDDDGLDVRHTAVAESVTLNTTNLSAAQDARIDSVVGIVVTLRGRTDGGVPNAMIPRVLDNGGSAQNGQAQIVGASNTSGSNFFPSNGAGGVWATGAGAGGINASESGYETA